MGKHSSWPHLWLLLWCMGCGGSLNPATSAPQGLSVDAVAVSPIRWRLAEQEAWHRYEKTRDMLQILAIDERLDVIGPWEFDRIRADLQPREYQTQTNLFPRAQKMRIPPANLLVLETTLEEDTANRTSEMTRKGQQKTDRSFDSRVEVTLRLVHPASGRVVATEQEQAIENRFSTTPDFDHRPTIRRLLRHTLNRMLRRVEKEKLVQFAAGPLTKHRIRVEENPRTVLDYDLDGPSLRSLLESVDSVLRKVRIYNRFRYHRPNVSAQDLERYLSLPKGVVVQEVAQSALQIGDVITHVNGQPIQWPFQWRRVLRRAKRNVTVQVVRAQQPLRLDIPVSPPQTP